MANRTIVKSGYLYRETSFLHRWKRNWFSVYADGILRFFESEEDGKPEEIVILRTECTNINTSPKDVSPPDGSLRDGLFSLTFTNHGIWNLCAESADDKQAWIYVIEGMRTQPVNYPLSAVPLAGAGLAMPGAYPLAPTVMGAPTQTIVVDGGPGGAFGYGHYGHHSFGHHGYGHHRYGYGHHGYPHGCPHMGYMGYCGHCSIWASPMTMSSPFGPSVAHPGQVISTNPAYPAAHYFPPN